jgi:hypothetical protein
MLKTNMSFILSLRKEYNMNRVYLNILITALIFSTSWAEDYTIPLEDNYQTMALWNMNVLSTLSDGKVINYDTFAYLPRTNRHLRFFSGSANGGTLVSGHASGFSKAAQFDGTDDYCKSFSAFPIMAGFQFEAWINIDSSTVDGSYIAEVPGSWYLTISNTGTRMNLYVANESGVFNSYCCRVAITPNAWEHITAKFVNGTAYLSVDGTTQSASAVLTNSSLYKAGQSDYVWVARRSSSGYYFKGLIDEIRLSDPGAQMPPTIYSDTLRGTQALYHFDQMNENITPDDASTGRRTPMDITAYNGAMISDDGIYPNDDASFCGHVVFDGMTQYLMRYNFITELDPTNFRVEAWVKMENDWWTGLVGQSFYIARKDPTFRLYASTDTGNVPQLNFTIYDTSTGSSVAKTIKYKNCKLTKWTHVAGECYNGTMKLFVNGALAASGTLTSTSVDNSQVLSVGSNLTNSVFWGSIDEMRIANVVAPPLQCGDYGYMQADLNKDCVVNFNDLRIMVGDWLDTLSGGEYGQQEDYQYYNCPKTALVPTLDGVASSGEWDDAKIVTLIAPDLVTDPQVGCINGDAPSVSDFSAVCYYKWDTTYLYLCINVQDANFISPLEGDTSGYPNDHVLFGFNPSVDNTIYDNTLQFEIFRDSAGSTKTNIYKNNGGALVLTNSVFASSQSASGWLIEAKLKWSEIMGNTSYVPAAGNKYGAALLMCDNDARDGQRDVFLIDAGDGNNNVMTLPELWHPVTLTNGLACGDNGYLANELGDKDCKINLYDFVIFADNWMASNMPE